MFTEFISVVSILSLLIFGTAKKISELSEEIEKNKDEIGLLHFFITMIMFSIITFFVQLMLINKEVISLNNFILEIPFVWRVGLFSSFIFLFYWVILPIFEFPEENMELSWNLSDPMTAHIISVFSFIILAFSSSIFEFLIRNHLDGGIFYIILVLFNIYVVSMLIFCIYVTAYFLDMKLG